MVAAAVGGGRASIAQSVEFHQEVAQEAGGIIASAISVLHSHPTQNVLLALPLGYMYFGGQRERFMQCSTISPKLTLNTTHRARRVSQTLLDMASKAPIGWIMEEGVC